MMKAHILGFPRIGVNRELKKSLEAYWSGLITQNELEKTGQELRNAIGKLKLMQV
jgi:5-methyltetrahydropteroyltriglutamate--homocysteine methyltransferase